MDEAKAAEFYQKACRGSLSSACDSFKRLTQENRSLAHDTQPADPAQGNSGAQAGTSTRGGQPANVAVKREQWALVVGISQYGPRVQGLRFARKDAESFFSFLRSPNGGNFLESHVLLLVDDQATSARVRGGMRDFLGQAGKDDVAVLYFAGHGAPDPRHPNALYLLTYDTSPDQLQYISTGYLLKGKVEVLNEFPPIQQAYSLRRRLPSRTNYPPVQCALR